MECSTVMSTIIVAFFERKVRKNDSWKEIAIAEFELRKRGIARI